MDHQVAIIFDVTAPTYEDAAREVVRSLKFVNRYVLGDSTVDEFVIESWWTLDERAKQFDHNDNLAGYVVFDD